MCRKNISCLFCEINGNVIFRFVYSFLFELVEYELLVEHLEYEHHDLSISNNELIWNGIIILIQNRITFIRNLIRNSGSFLSGRGRCPWDTKIRIKFDPEWIKFDLVDLRVHGLI